VLVPLDGSELGEASLALAQELADHFDSQIHLVRVVSIPPISEGMAGDGGGAAQLMDSMVDGARQYLQTTAERITSVGGVKTEVLIGPAAPQLEDYVAANDIGLVIMTSHGRGGIVRTALGSVTDRLLGGGKAPVLVVRSV
jgi:nucleotide-binding universal stress UspA family protein